MATIVPAILEHHLRNVQHRIKQVKASRYHIDIMDGQFVRRKTIGCRALSKLRTNAVIDAHLMVRHPLLHVKHAAKWADRLIAHVEATSDIAGFIKACKKAKVKAGLAINPGTPIKRVLPFVKAVDFVLIMTVHPGRQGQKFLNHSLASVSLLHKKARKLKIGIDGGVNAAVVKAAKKAGASVICAGSSIFWSGNPKKAYLALARAAR